MKIKYIMFRLVLSICLLSGCNTNNRVTVINTNDIETEISKTDDTESLAKLYYKLGKSKKQSYEVNLALDAFEKSIKKYKQLHLSSDNLNVSKCYDELGEIYILKKEYHKALEFFKKSLKIKEKQFSSINRKLVISYKYIGETYDKLSNRREALFWLNKAEWSSRSIDGYNLSSLTLDIRAKISAIKKTSFSDNKIKLIDYILKYGKISIEVANLYKGMGREHQSREEFDDAFDAYIESTEIYKKLLPSYRKELYATYFELSNVSKKIGKNKDYLKSSIKAFDSYFANRQRMFSTFDIQEQKSFSVKRKKYLYNLFDSISLYHDKNSIEKVLNLWINYKRSIFDFENSLYLFSKKDSHLESKYNEWNRKKRELATLEQGMSSYNKKDILKKTSELEQDMSYIFSKYNSKIVYQNISKHLKPNELYLDFAKVKDSYYYFTLDKKENITFKKIDKEKTEKIELVIKAIQQDNIDTRELNTAQKEYGKLYQLIIEPLFSEITDKNSLVISPDGLLNLIPFEAFYNKKVKRYLIQNYSIRYIPSGKEFVKLYEDNSISNQDIIIFANSDFNSINKNKTRGSIFDGLKEFDNLDYAVDEANSVRSSFLDPQYIIDENATEENFMKISKPKIWHIITHGFLSKNKNVLNPLLNCGIVLYGANESIRNKKGDGIITGLELAGMDLKGTELVVLSACLTGVGEVDNSEGVASISKAFRKAGAKYLLTTLWSIDDEMTAELMEKFYKYSNENLSYSKALQKAKVDLIMDSSNYHPYYWAGFVGS